MRRDLRFRGEGARVRVTGGELAGRRMRAPRAGGVRPTTDRVRESLFARLGALDGARALDLYAGSGALGIEALSRGAASVTFVERSGAVLRVLAANVEALGLADRSRILRGDVRAVLARLARGAERFDLILADPPYDAEDADRALAVIGELGLLAPGGTLVREASRRHPPGTLPGLRRVDERRYGDTLIVRYTSPAEPAPVGETERP